MGGLSPSTWKMDCSKAAPFSWLREASILPHPAFSHEMLITWIHWGPQTIAISETFCPIRIIFHFIEGDIICVENAHSSLRFVSHPAPAMTSGGDLG